MGEVDGAAVSGAEIRDAAARLRLRHASILPSLTAGRVVDALSTLGRKWRRGELEASRVARRLHGVFGYAGTQLTLDALLASLAEHPLNELIDAEQVRDVPGFPLIGHVIAGNTPLLGWTSVIRALLVRSASLVKLPSVCVDHNEGSTVAWMRLFVDALAQIDAELVSTIELMAWSGSDEDSNGVLCDTADLVIAYGSDTTIGSVRGMRGERPFLGYGHRLSFGIVLADADLLEAAQGFAVDVLLYDQGGCLSPHSIYVEGGAARVGEFAAELSDALDRCARSIPGPNRTETEALAIGRAKALARMEGAGIREGADLRWTVVERCDDCFAPSPTHGVISVQPIPSIQRLPSALADVSGLLQGCGVSGGANDVVDLLRTLGISYICAPGRMQAPPLSWREDGVAVLSSLVPDPTRDRHSKSCRTAK